MQKRKKPEPEIEGAWLLIIIFIVLVALRFTPLYQPPNAAIHQRR